MKAYFGLDDLDMKIESYIPKRGGTFFEAGANDGLRQSNTAYFERSKGWTGVLVEPSPTLFARCCNNRSGATRCFNAALVPNDWELPDVELIYCDLMSVTDSGLVDLDREAHIEWGLEFLDPASKPFAYRAPARTIASILAEVSITRLDLLSLDLEGFEVPALRGLDVEAVEVDYICVEAWNLDKVVAVLGPRYSVVAKLSHHDYLFRRTA